VRPPDDDRFEGQSSVADVGRVCRVCFGMHLKPKLGWGDKAPASSSKGACEDDVMSSDASEGSIAVDARALVVTFV